ncbi:101_t:CDS:2 [Acaulospora colombiana]|uniref:101_t:CDS:1 n=1 Tax=Acaulospora colombiana TaxID=27376 RepID=A0ACA9LQD9_9GLOM|nr:101_t:CDS:2 [Acaulospora colombiana]
MPRVRSTRSGKLGINPLLFDSKLNVYNVSLSFDTRQKTIIFFTSKKRSRNIETENTAHVLRNSLIYSTYDLELESFPPASYNASRIDLVGVLLMLLPIGLFIPLASLTGHYADINQIGIANTLYMASCVAWLVFGIFYLTGSMLFWNRFIASVGNVDYTTIGKKLTAALKLLSACFFLVVVPLYDVFYRSHTVWDYGADIVYLVIGDYFVPLLIHITQWTIIYNTFVSEPAKVSSVNIQEEKGDDDYYEADYSLNSGYNSSTMPSRNDPSQPQNSHNNIFSLKPRRATSMHDTMNANSFFFNSERTKSEHKYSESRHSINSFSDSTTLSTVSTYGYSNGSGSNIKKELVKKHQSAIVNI